MVAACLTVGTLEFFFSYKTNNGGIHFCFADAPVEHTGGHIQKTFKITLNT